MTLSSVRGPGERRLALFLCGGRDKAMGAALPLGDTHDLAAIIDAKGHGDRGIGDIQWFEDAVGIQKAMGSALIDVLSYDLAALVDPIG
jgi:hypothetical protein